MHSSRSNMQKVDCIVFRQASGITESKLHCEAPSIYHDVILLLHIFSCYIESRSSFNIEKNRNYSGYPIPWKRQMFSRYAEITHDSSFVCSEREDPARLYLALLSMKLGVFIELSGMFYGMFSELRSMYSRCGFDAYSYFHFYFYFSMSISIVHDSSMESWYPVISLVETDPVECVSMHRSTLFRSIPAFRLFVSYYRRGYRIQYLHTRDWVWQDRIGGRRRTFLFGFPLF